MNGKIDTAGLIYFPTLNGCVGDCWKSGFSCRKPRFKGAGKVITFWAKIGSRKWKIDTLMLATLRVACSVLWMLSCCCCCIWRIGEYCICMVYVCMCACMDASMCVGQYVQLLPVHIKMQFICGWKENSCMRYLRQMWSTLAHSDMRCGGDVRTLYNFLRSFFICRITRLCN